MNCSALKMPRGADVRTGTAPRGPLRGAFSYPLVALAVNKSKEKQNSGTRRRRAHTKMRQTPEGVAAKRVP